MSKKQHLRDVARAKAKRASKVVKDEYKRPSKFKSFSETITYAKKSVYSITRIREINGQTFAVTIGTAFLVAPYKLLTCSHVINNIDPNVNPKKHPLAFHKDGDVYYLLNKDPLDKDHYYRLNSKMLHNIHLYSEFDAAVITVEDDFYTNGKNIFQHKDNYLKITMQPKDLGTEVAVLGFPEEKDDEKDVSGVYIDKRTNNLRDELIKKRVDRGVVNARYIDEQGVQKYDFTMAFNPGNSGGPIIDKDGKLIAIVHGYTAFVTKVIDETFVMVNPNGEKETKTWPTTLKAIYSIGISAENFKPLITEHGLEN